MWKAIQSFLRVRKGSQTFQQDQTANPLSAVLIVALIISEQDRALLRNVAIPRGIDVKFTESCSEAWTIANQLQASVILCDRDLPGTEWRDVMQILASAPQHPSVILTSSVVDDYLWQEDSQRRVRRSAEAAEGRGCRQVSEARMVLLEQRNEDAPRPLKR